MKEITKEGEKRKFIQNNALPFVFGILSRNNSYYGVGNFTNELGARVSGIANADTMLSLLAGCHSYIIEYTGFYLEPKLCFLQGAEGNFNKKKSYIKYQYNKALAKRS